MQQGQKLSFKVILPMTAELHAAYASWVKGTWFLRLTWYAGRWNKHSALPEYLLPALLCGALACQRFQMSSEVNNDGGEWLKVRFAAVSL